MYFGSQEVILHSKHGKDTAIIVYQRDNNNVLAYRFNSPNTENSGTFYTAIFNPFVGLCYVDDIYGALTEAKAREMFPEAKSRINYLLEFAQSF